MMITSFNWMESLTGSPIMLVLIGCSVITAGVALERALYFWKHRGNPDETFSFAIKSITAGNADAASMACRSTPHPMGQAVLQVIQHMGQPGKSIEERLQVILSEQKLLLEQNLGLLGTMAAIAPLVGLLGTVWGIMRAFHDMSLAGSAAPSVVAAGVAEALVTTAAGLVVAIPAVLLYNHFSRRANVMLTVAENSARSVRTVMTETGQTGTSQQQAA